MIKDKNASSLNFLFNSFYRGVKKNLREKGIELSRKELNNTHLGLIAFACDLCIFLSGRNPDHFTGFHEIRFLTDDGSLYEVKVSHTDETKEELKKIKENTNNEPTI